MGLFDRFFGPPNEAGFAKIVMAELKRVGDTRTASFDPKEFRLDCSVDGKNAGVINLRNIYAEYCRLDKADRRKWLNSTCIGLAREPNIPSEFEDASHDLRPSVRSRSLIDIIRLDTILSGGEPQEWPTVPLSEHLVVALVYDLPTTMGFVPDDKLDEWGVSLYEAMEVAQRNLESLEYAMMGLGESLFIFENGDAYDATRLLLKDRIRQLPVKGDPVAMPVTRECLLVTGSDDEAGLGMMADIAKEKLDDPRPVCTIPVRLVGGDWETWMPPPGHPHHEKYRAMALQHFGGDYSTQKELLERVHEKTGRDIFVATFSGMEKDGVAFSYATWSKNVPTLLPKTDRLALYDADTEAMYMAEWDKVHEVVGDLMTPTEHYPPRWFVEEFPTPEQLKAMRAENVG
jgi:uncharacterized protein YtpQ (UPF0354 family)